MVLFSAFISSSNLLVDGVVSIQDYVLVSGYKVEGTAISTSKLKAALGDYGYNNWCKEHNIFNAEIQEKF